MKNSCYKKTLVFGIIVLLICGAVTSSIGSSIRSLNVDDKNLEGSSSVIDPSSFTFYAIDKNGIKHKNNELSIKDSEDLMKLFNDFKQKHVNDPDSDITREVKNEFTDMLDENDLINES